MEPMTLGSAPSSPASPGINPHFLPSFLMGDSQPSTPNPSVSPGRNRHSGSFRGLPSTEPRSLRQKLFNQSITDTPVQSPFLPSSEKAGPPKQGLFDTLESAKRPTSPILCSTAHFNDTQQQQQGFNESISRIHDDSINYSRNMNFNDRTMNASQRDKIDSQWVTVFGFPPSALTVVLSQLSNCGPIADKKIPAQGNWVHVKYNNLNEVARALSLNGRCINNCVMIGVQLYHAKENKEHDNNACFTSPIRARSLRHSFVSPGQANTVIPPQTLPQKSTGIVTKAMEYVFGW